MVSLDGDFILLIKPMPVSDFWSKTKKSDRPKYSKKVFMNITQIKSMSKEERLQAMEDISFDKVCEELGV